MLSPIAEIMSFNGSLPELNNGRLAMVRARASAVLARRALRAAPACRCRCALHLMPPRRPLARSPQLGFLAALGCEIFTGKPVMAQLAGNGTTILGWMVAVSLGSLAPIMRVLAGGSLPHGQLVCTVAGTLQAARRRCGSASGGSNRWNGRHGSQAASACKMAAHACVWVA